MLEGVACWLLRKLCRNKTRLQAFYCFCGPSALLPRLKNIAPCAAPLCSSLRRGKRLRHRSVVFWCSLRQKHGSLSSPYAVAKEVLHYPPAGAFSGASPFSPRWGAGEDGTAAFISNWRWT